MRVLLARAGALGDLLLLRPALWRLRAHGHAVTLLAPTRTAALLVGPHACQADTLLDGDGADAARLFAGATPAAWRETLGRCELAIVYTRCSDLVTALGRAIHEVLAHDPQPPDGMHAAAWLCEPVRKFVRPDPPPLPLLPAAAASHHVPLVIHPGSGSRHKNWPAERFIEAARRLSEGRPWVWLTGPAERALSTPPDDARVCSSPPIGQLASLLAGAGLYLGNDSGVSHLAAAVGAPTLALFGPTEASMWAPLGPRVHALQAPAGRLEDLSVDSVVRAAEGLRAHGSGY